MAIGKSGTGLTMPEGQPVMAIGKSGTGLTMPEGD